MRLFVLLSVFLMGVFLSACSTLGMKNHSNDYVKNSQEISPIMIPANASLIKKKTYYVIPSVQSAVGSHSVSLKPPTLLGEVPKRS